MSKLLTRRMNPAAPRSSPGATTPMLNQRTLKNAIKTTGVGLHTGARVDRHLRPSAPDSGIVFHRIDLPQTVSIPARAESVGDTRLSSTLKKDGASISTVEHLMSALAGLGIDNLHIDVAGPEIPIMDGSAGPFVFLLQSAGIVEQAALKRYLRIKAPVEVRDGDKWARFESFDGDALRRSRTGRQSAKRDRARRDPGAEQRGSALRQRIRQTQGIGRDRRHLFARPPVHRAIHGIQIRPRAQ